MPRTKPPNGSGKIKASDDFPLLHFPPFMRLNPQQKNFILLYWIKPIKRWSDAAIYSKAYGKPIRTEKDKDHAGQSATALKSKPGIISCLRRMEKVRLERLNVSVERIMEHEASIAFSDIGFLFDEDGLSPLPPGQIPPEVRQAISNVEIKEKKISVPDANGRKRTHTEYWYKYSFWNKGNALERLCKLKGMHKPEQHNHMISGLPGLPVELHTSLDVKSISTEDLKTLMNIINKVTGD